MREKTVRIKRGKAYVAAILIPGDNGFDLLHPIVVDGRFVPWEQWVDFLGMSKTQRPTTQPQSNVVKMLESCVENELPVSGATRRIRLPARSILRDSIGARASGCKKEARLQYGRRTTALEL